MLIAQSLLIIYIFIVTKIIIFYIMIRNFMLNVDLERNIYPLTFIPALVICLWWYFSNKKPSCVHIIRSLFKIYDYLKIKDHEWILLFNFLVTFNL